MLKPEEVRYIGRLALAFSGYPRSISCDAEYDYMNCRTIMRCNVKGKKESSILTIHCSFSDEELEFPEAVSIVRESVKRMAEALIEALEKEKGEPYSSP